MNLLEFHKQIKGYTQNRQPGTERDMDPRPISEQMNIKQLVNCKVKVALITGGDSGLVALLRSYLQKRALM